MKTPKRIIAEKHCDARVKLDACERECWRRVQTSRCEQ